MTGFPVNSVIARARLDSATAASHLRPLQNRTTIPIPFHPPVDCNYNLDYITGVRLVVFSPAAIRQYKRLPAAARSLLKKEIHERLALEDPTEENRNRFRLRRFSPHADFELRVESWRAFYRVQENLVTVELIGRKKGNVLLIEGKEFKL